MSEKLSAYEIIMLGKIEIVITPPVNNLHQLGGCNVEIKFHK